MMLLSQSRLSFGRMYQLGSTMPNMDPERLPLRDGTFATSKGGDSGLHAHRLADISQAMEKMQLSAPRGGARSFHTRTRAPVLQYYGPSQHPELGCDPARWGHPVALALCCGSEPTFR